MKILSLALGLVFLSVPALAETFNGNLNGTWNCYGKGQIEISGSNIYSGNSVVGHLHFVRGFKYPSGVTPVSGDPNGLIILGDSCQKAN